MILEVVTPIVKTIGAFNEASQTQLVLHEDRMMEERDVKPWG
jgi:hypothetical protein